mgnify:CR=1 FL=1
MFGNSLEDGRGFVRGVVVLVMGKNGARGGVEKDLVEGQPATKAQAGFIPAV